MVVYVQFFTIFAQVSILPKCGWRVHNFMLSFHSLVATISSYSSSKYFEENIVGAVNEENNLYYIYYIVVIIEKNKYGLLGLLQFKSHKEYIHILLIKIKIS